MQAPTLSLFDYYTAFLSVVLGLAVADMAVSTHKLMLARARVRFRLIPIMGALAVFGLILGHFLRLWNGGLPMTEVGFYQVATGTLYCLVLFLLAGSSLPDQVPEEGLDLHDWYFPNRGYLFGLACALQLWDGGLQAWHIATHHVLAGDAAGAGTFEWFTLARFLVAALFCAALARFGNRWWHLIGLTILLLTIHFGFGTWTLRYPREDALGRQPAVNVPLPGAPPVGPAPRR